MADKKEVQDTDDYKLSKTGRKIRAHRIIFNKGEDDGNKGIKEGSMKKTYTDFVQEHTLPLTEEQLDEIVSELQEVLGKDAKAGDWISDFVHSDNPKFAGKSKEKRKQMALAAFYAKQRNEEVEMEEELKGNQHKLDKNKNGKLDKHDFKLLRKEDAEQIDELSKGTLKRYSDAAHKDFSKNFQHDQNFTGIHSAIRTAMAKTNSGTGGVHSLKGTKKNPLRKHDAVQAGLKTAADAVTAARAPFKHKMKVRNQGMDRADARLNKEETAQIDEAIHADDYTATSEKSQFGGHRPHVVNKETGKTMHLSGHAYKSPEHAKAHAKAYLTAYAKTGPNAADRAAQDYARANKDKQVVKEEAELEEGWADMLAQVKKSGDASKTATATKHDVKKTSTGTVYTKQRDADGMSKEFKRDPGEAKRGRGRPKKNSFSEAAEFLMGLDEETFDSLMEEGFDSFMEAFAKVTDHSTK